MGFDWILRIEKKKIHKKTFQPTQVIIRKKNIPIAYSFSETVSKSCSNFFTFVPMWSTTPRPFNCSTDGSTMTLVRGPTQNSYSHGNTLLTPVATLIRLTATGRNSSIGWCSFNTDRNVFTSWLKKATRYRIPSPNTSMCIFSRPFSSNS